MKRRLLNNSTVSFLTVSSRNSFIIASSSVCLLGSGSLLGEGGNRAVQEAVLQQLERPFDVLAVLLRELAVELGEEFG